MKVDRSRFKQTRYKASEECEDLIEFLRSCSESQLLENLKSVTSSNVGKCQLIHWIDVLDRFDTIYEKQCDLNGNSTASSWLETGELEDLTVACLNFTALLIEHCSSRTLEAYNSLDRLAALLVSARWEIILAILALLFVFSKRSVALKSMENGESLLQQLFNLVENWGGQEHGLKLADCCRDLSQENRLQSAQARVLSLAVLVYSDVSQVMLESVLYGGLIEEMVDVLKLEDPRLTEIKYAILGTLTAIVCCDQGPRFQDVIEATGAAKNDGFLPVMVRKCIDQLTDPNMPPFPHQLATALFSFLYHLGKYEKGGEALVSCLLMESLLKVVNHYSDSHEFITFVTRAVVIIDLITNLDMNAFQTHNGLDILEKRMRHEVPSGGTATCQPEQPVDDVGRQYHHRRFALVKSLQNFFEKVEKDPSFVNSVHPSVGLPVVENPKDHRYKHLPKFKVTMGNLTKSAPSRDGHLCTRSTYEMDVLYRSITITWNGSEREEHWEMFDKACGMGDYASVYRIHKKGDEDAGQCIKQLTKEKNEDLMQFIERTNSEAATQFACSAQELADYHNILPLYGISEVFQFGNKDRVFLLLPFIQGGNFLDLLFKGHRVITPQNLSEILAQSLSGLAIIHQKGIAHRDLHLQNFMLTKSLYENDFAVLIADFGKAVASWSKNKDEDLQTFQFNDILQLLACMVSLWISEPPESIIGLSFKNFIPSGSDYKLFFEKLRNVLKLETLNAETSELQWKWKKGVPAPLRSLFTWLEADTEREIEGRRKDPITIDNIIETLNPPQILRPLYTPLVRRNEWNEAATAISSETAY